jgi:AraC-like DNA-binding protein
VISENDAMIDDDFIARVAAFAEARGIRDEPVECGAGGLAVWRSLAPTPIRPAHYQPVICLVLQGAKQVSVGRSETLLSKGKSLIVSVDLPTISRVVEASREKPYLTFSLPIDMALLREVAGEMDLAGVEAREANAISAAEADKALVDAMDRLFGVANKPATAAMLAPLILREIHFWMLMADHGGMLRELCRADSRAARIARSIGIIRRDFTARLRVEDLARAAAMSSSAFHDHFKTITGTTPLQFQKQLRLMEAKRLIASGETSVSSAAYRVGYESPTQFSREYARAFGAPPRNDIPSRVSEPA